jgi:hypothetical protein
MVLLENAEGTHLELHRFHMICFIEQILISL